MVELFFVEAVGMPAEFVAQMRQAPWWPAQEALAPTLIQNAEIMDDFSLPAERVAKVTTPTLVIDGGETPWLSYAAQAVADALPHAERRTISGQPHNVAPEAHSSSAGRVFLQLRRPAEDQRLARFLSVIPVTMTRWRHISAAPAFV